jgi:hypothetical protein
LQHCRQLAVITRLFIGHVAPQAKTKGSRPGTGRGGVTDQTKKGKTDGKTFDPHSDDLKDGEAKTVSVLCVNLVTCECHPPDKP